jgi:hypothetical protein
MPCAIAGDALKLSSYSTVRSIVFGRIGAVLALNPCEEFRAICRVSVVETLKRGLPPATARYEVRQWF